MKHIRKFFAMFLALLMVMSLSATAYAAEDPSSAVIPPVPIEGQAVSVGGIVSPQSVGNILTSGANDFYGDGSLDIYLSSGRSWGYIYAGTGGTTSTGYVTISVKFPTGSWYEIGRVTASGGDTGYRQFSYLPSGMYHFLFENDTEGWIQVYAEIYD